MGALGGQRQDKGVTGPGLESGCWKTSVESGQEGSVGLQESCAHKTGVL